MNTKYRRSVKAWLKLATSLFDSPIEVLYSTCESYVGVKGTIIDESSELFIIQTKDKIVKIPKKNQVFRIWLKNDTSILVDGKILVGRPGQRLKKKVKLW